MTRIYAIYEVCGLVPSPADWAPPVGAAVIAGLAAMVSVVVATVRGPRERRRALYGEAFRHAMAWQEGLYRVRRRGGSAEQTAEVVAHFHDLQERIDQHRAWLASESYFLANSYCTFVDHVKGQCLPLIQEAWKTPGLPPSEDHGSLPHPKGVERAARRFLRDVRLHLLAFLGVPWLVLAFRNRTVKR